MRTLIKYNNFMFVSYGFAYCAFGQDRTCHDSHSASSSTRVYKLISTLKCWGKLFDEWTRIPSRGE